MMQKKISALLLWVLAMMLIAACDDDDGKDSATDTEDTGNEPVDTACSDGDWMVCDCDGANTGVAECADGDFGDCECKTDNGLDRVCGTCHGDAASSAPPIDLSGETETSLMTVGTHREHLFGGDWHRQVACEDCHVVPAEIESEGHLDSGRADLVFSEIAGGENVVFNAETGTCDNVYCHGSSLDAGGDNTSPVWNIAGEGQAACGSCHALPPTGGHPTSTACGMCHGSVYDHDNEEWVDGELHINGTVDF